MLIIRFVNIIVGAMVLLLSLLNNILMTFYSLLYIPVPLLIKLKIKNFIISLFLI